MAHRGNVGWKMGTERVLKAISLEHMCAWSQPLLFLGLFQKCLFCLILVPGRQDLSYRTIKIIQKKSLTCISYHTPVISILCLALDILYKSG